MASPGVRKAGWQEGHGADPTAAAPQPGAEAVAAFERSMALLQRHRFQEAGAGFEDLLDRFPGEEALGDRARVYLGLCHRAAGRSQTDPLTVEDRLRAATAALNDNDDERAKTLAEEVTHDAPSSDLAWYLLAAVAARRNQPDLALAHLGHAIAASPDVRAQARYEPDFAPLRALRGFRELVETPPRSSVPLPNGRHARRPRSER